VGLIFIQISVIGSERHVLCSGVPNGHLRLSKVIDFGTNQKRTCNFLLVINSNLGLIFLHFRDTAGFLLRTVTPTLFHLNFGDVPWPRFLMSEDPKLIICVITFELTKFIWPRYFSVTDGRLTVAIMRHAHSASPSKKPRYCPREKRYCCGLTEYSISNRPTRFPTQVHTTCTVCIHAV